MPISAEKTRALSFISIDAKNESKEYNVSRHGIELPVWGTQA